jgi:hypothetical protein
MQSKICLCFAKFRRATTCIVAGLQQSHLRVSQFLFELNNLCLEIAGPNVVPVLE